MPFALLIIGAVLLIAAARGKTDGQQGLFALVQGDFTGHNNFLYWMTAILIIGAIGYIPKLKGLSVAFLSLVVVVLFLTKGDPTKAGGGFFEKFTAGLASTTAPPQTATQAANANTIASVAQSVTPGLSPAMASVAGAGMAATPGLPSLDLLHSLPLTNTVQ